MSRDLAVGLAATAVLDRAAGPAAIAGLVRAGLAAHSGRPGRFEAATAVLVAVRRRKAAVRVVRPIAGPAAKQVRRGCEKVVHSAAIAAELEPDSEPATAGFVRAAGPVQVAVPTAEERRKESPEPEAAGFVAEPAEQYFDRGSSCLAVAGEEAAAPIAGEVLAAGWEWEHIPAVPIVAVRVAVAAGAEAAGSTAAVLQEEHFEVLGSVPIVAVRAAVAAVAVVPTAAEQTEARGTGQAEAASTAAASLAQAATEQLVLG